MLISRPLQAFKDGVSASTHATFLVSGCGVDVEMWTKGTVDQPALCAVLLLL